MSKTRLQEVQSPVALIDAELAAEQLRVAQERGQVVAHTFCPGNAFHAALAAERLGREDVWILAGYRDTPSRGWAQHQNMHCWIRIGPQHLEVSPQETLEGATYLVAEELEPGKQTFGSIVDLAQVLFNEPERFTR